MDEQVPSGPQIGYKPNIYPIMYWALAYGVIAGVILFIVYLLSRYITVIWFPVFLAGLIWGGYRNYQKQKSVWYGSQGMTQQKKSPVEELKEAVGDIVDASREMMAEQPVEGQNELAAESQEFEPPVEETEDQNNTTPPTPPVPPTPTA